VIRRHLLAQLPLLVGLAILSSLPMAASRGQTAADPSVDIEGTIVSIREGILEIRPTLQHSPERVSVGDATDIVSESQITQSALRPGMRIGCGGRYSAATGLTVGFAEVADRPIGELKAKSVGMEIHADQGWARLPSATLKSVSPLIVTDDAGKDYKLTLGPRTRFFRIQKQGPDYLLIGTRVQVSGLRAPDGVIQASSVTPERDDPKPGSMFGTVQRVDGNILTVLPRYATDAVSVAVAPACKTQRERVLLPEQFHVGDRVTVWGERHPAAAGGGGSGSGDDVLAIAVLVGPGRFPSDQGDGAPVFLSGTLKALEPDVLLKLPSGETVTVIVPGQIILATLLPARSTEIAPGAEALFVLKRPDAAVAVSGRSTQKPFLATSIVLDAPPYAGYGR
jgi:hypothetical protein